MNKEIIKVIPECFEKIGKFTPAKHREFRKSMACFLPFVIIYCIHKERMTDKKYKYEELKLQMEHEEKMAEIKVKLLSREEESEDEKDN